MTLSFRFARMPELLFGPGRFADIPAVVRRFGKKVLLVTGSRSLRGGGLLDTLAGSLVAEGIEYRHVVIAGEPSPEDVDNAVSETAGDGIDVVVAIGGGSVLDAGKAIAAMLPLRTPVTDYLEIVGTGAPHPGTKKPLIAVPTTAGTGSEAAKNAVLSQVGPSGFKRSLRHDNFVPDVAVIDPALTASCPSNLTAACGMDAITQLIESYVSVKSSSLTDSLARPAFGLAAQALVPACTTHPHDLSVRGRLSYASFISGVTLANAGLGVVHGIAGVMGGYLSIPHGALCGTLIAEATKACIMKLRRAGELSPLMKYADLGAFLTRHEDMESRLAALTDRLDEWTNALGLPRLAVFGATEDMLNKVARESTNKESPAHLTGEEISALLMKRL